MCSMHVILSHVIFLISHITYNKDKVLPHTDLVPVFDAAGKHVCGDNEIITLNVVYAINI